ncbi:nucleotidyltransferase domain-containing protein [Thermus sediminis]|uniref:nucleotidyltransferase domain-containing protein n=1 Tax=Thermus sediminis TaxID=1761908 RepID=UPI000E3C4FA2|nr:nucleotidyltransferase domain-containing protein [Thermus sediminis]
MEAGLKAYPEEAAARLRGALDLEALYPFGSHARGTADPRSDLDLPVVARTPLPPLARIGLVLELLRDAPLPVEAIVLTPEELLERRGLPEEEAPYLKSLLPQALDKLHIPTRYPDALPGLTPQEAYTEEGARKALEDAQAILEAVEVRLGQG